MTRPVPSTSPASGVPMIGIHASHEQFTPDRLLRLMQLAEAAGFDAGMCSDHWAPWSEEQGQSGFAWTWLGAALQATSMSFGVVNARYHPAIIAQAAATLAVMFPLASGSPSDRVSSSTNTSRVPQGLPSPSATPGSVRPPT